MPAPKKPPRPEPPDPFADDGLLEDEDKGDPDTDELEPPPTEIEPEAVDDPPTDRDWSVPVGVPYSDVRDGLFIDEEAVRDDGWGDDKDDLLDDGDGEDDFPDETEEPAPAAEEAFDFVEEEQDLTDDEWGDLEARSARLPEGMVVAGYEERVDLPDLGLSEVQARCETGCATSSISAALAQPGHDGALPLRVVLCGTERVVRLAVVAGGEPVVVLGRDALAGWALVDASRRSARRP